MNAAPVLIRELRQLARSPGIYRIRWIVLAPLLWIGFLSLTPMGMQGPMVFWGIEIILHWAIWLFVPLMTADCISRERREGTLQLLFLTPLSATGIVVAKATGQALRAATLLLAMLPAVAIPVLLGGVSGGMLVRAATMSAACIILALAAGTLASALSARWDRGVALAVLLAALFARGWHMYLALSGFGDTWAFFSLEAGGGPFGGMARTQWSLREAAHLVKSAMGVGVLVLLVSAFVVETTKRDRVASKFERWLGAVFLRPMIWRDWLKRITQLQLDKNPIGFLLQYKASARLTKWIWLAGILFLQSMILGGSLWDAFLLQHYTALFLYVGIAMNAAGAFRVDRESGALELILVTPYTHADVIWGRLKALMSQFSWGIAIIVVVRLALEGIGVREPWRDVWWTSMPENLFVFEVIGTSVVVVVIGMAESLLRSNYVAALILTLAKALILPAAVSGMVSVFGLPDNFLVLSATVKVGFMIQSWKAMDACLEQRAFVRA